MAALLLSLGAPLVPSKEEQARLSKLWKKPIPSPIDILDRRFGSAHASRAVTQAKERQTQRTPRSPLNLALLRLIVLTRDRYVVTHHAPNSTLANASFSPLRDTPETISQIWRICCPRRRCRSCSPLPSARFHRGSEPLATSCRVGGKKTRKKRNEYLKIKIHQKMSRRRDEDEDRWDRRDRTRDSYDRSRDRDSGRERVRSPDRERHRRDEDDRGDRERRRGGRDDRDDRGDSRGRGSEGGGSDDRFKFMNPERARMLQRIEASGGAAQDEGTLPPPPKNLLSRLPSLTCQVSSSRRSRRKRSRSGRWWWWRLWWRRWHATRSAQPG